MEENGQPAQKGGSYFPVCSDRTPLAGTFAEEARMT